MITHKKIIRYLAQNSSDHHLNIVAHEGAFGCLHTEAVAEEL